MCVCVCEESAYIAIWLGLCTRAAADSTGDRGRFYSWVLVVSHKMAAVTAHKTTTITDSLTHTQAHRHTGMHRHRHAHAVECYLKSAAAPDGEAALATLRRSNSSSNSSKRSRRRKRSRDVGGRLQCGGC